MRTRKGGGGKGFCVRMRAQENTAVTPPSQKCASVPCFELRRSRAGSPTVTFTPLERCLLGTEWKLFDAYILVYLRF